MDLIFSLVERAAVVGNFPLSSFGFSTRDLICVIVWPLSVCFTDDWRAPNQGESMSLDNSSRGLRDAQSELVIHPASLKSTRKNRLVHV